MTALYRTDQLRPAERVEAWRHTVSTAFVPFEVSEIDAETFTGEISAATYGALEASDVRSRRQLVRRTPTLIDSSEHDYYKLGLQLSGYCVVSQAGREAALTPGDFTLYDCAQPFQLAFDDSFRMLAFMFPRRLLHLPATAVNGALGRRISGRNGLGALITPLLVSLIERTEEVPVSVSQHVADSVLDLLVAVFTEQTGATPDDPDPLRRSLLLRIKAFIESRLGDPDLAPDTIASAHHISIRYLHRLYEAESTTVSRYIRTRRLEHCRRDLADPRQANTAVAAVAARWGFTDPANFSSAFRSAFGVTPRAHRALALTANGLQN